MAHSKQALKRARQSEKNRIANKAKMSALKTAMKALEAAIKAGDKAKATELALKAIKSADKAAEKGVIHKNNASRKKSQIATAVAKLA
jgi:small subunit ribosomal protein S20